MLITVRAVVEEDGRLRLMAGDISLALVSASALADYWDNPEEDEAWADL